MRVNGVDVYVDVNFGRRNGKRKLFKALETMKDQDFQSVEECVSLINGFAEAVEVNFEEVE